MEIRIEHRIRAQCWTETLSESSSAFAAEQLDGEEVSIVTVAGAHDTQLTLLSTTFNQPTGIALDKSGTVWIAEQGAGTIDRVTAQGDVVRYTVDSPTAEPEDLIAAPDGTMWFSEFGSGEVGPFTPAHPTG